MTNHELEHLQQCPDPDSLRSTLHALCSQYGTVTRLSVLPADHAGKRQVLCLLQMASPEEEEHLMRGLGIGRFGGELVVIVNLQSPAQSVPSVAVTPAPRSQLGVLTGLRYSGIRVPEQQPVQRI